MIADDMLWYRAKAEELLMGIGKPIVRIEGKQPLRFLVGEEVHRFDWELAPWLDVVILFTRGRDPMPVAPADLSADTTIVARYFETGPGA